MVPPLALLHFMDSSMDMIDWKRNYDSYTAVLENRKEDMASSHQMKHCAFKYKLELIKNRLGPGKEIKKIIFLK